jgi:hypothetical protein
MPVLAAPVLVASVPGILDAGRISHPVLLAIENAHGFGRRLVLEQVGRWEFACVFELSDLEIEELLPEGLVPEPERERTDIGQTPGVDLDDDAADERATIGHIRTTQIPEGRANVAQDERRAARHGDDEDQDQREDVPFSAVHGQASPVVPVPVLPGA